MCRIATPLKIMRLCHCGESLLSFFLIIIVGAHTACAASRQTAVHVEGEYYGKPTIAFSLLMTKDRFVKSYSNGVTIAGTKTARGAIYYFVKYDGKLVIKVNQDNLYRIGEVSNPSSAVIKFEVSCFRQLRQRLPDFRHYISNNFWFVWEQESHPLQQDFELW